MPKWQGPLLPPMLKWQGPLLPSLLWPACQLPGSPCGSCHLGSDAATVCRRLTRDRQPDRDRNKHRKTRDRHNHRQTEKGRETDKQKGRQTTVI
eukprot:6490535-Amphidinium_carterae.1